MSSIDLRPVEEHLDACLPDLNGSVGLFLVQGERLLMRSFLGTYTADTVIPIASATKLFSGAVILALVDEGTIRLETQAREYLPSFTGDKAGITVRQMFSHTSGLPMHPMHDLDASITLSEAVERISRMPLLAPPGTALIYSNAGMQAAGRIAELACDAPWAEIFQDRIARPLSLERTGYLARGQTRNPSIGGTITTTLDELGRLVSTIVNRGFYDGRRVLGSAAVGEMLRNQTGDVPIVQSPYQKFAHIDAAMPGFRYGIGCWIERLDEETGEALEVSSGGMFGTQPWIDTTRNLGGVFFVRARNEQAVPAYWQTKRLIRQIVPELEPATRRGGSG